MKIKKGQALLIRLMIIVLLCVLNQPLVAEEKATVSLALGEWPPYIGETLPHYGTVTDVVSDAFRSQGYDVTFGFFPWKRSFVLTRLAQWDTTAVWIKNSERENDFIYSDSVLVLDNVLFYRKDKPFDWKTLDDLKGYVVGGSTGYSYGPILDQGEKQGIFTLDRIPEEKMNFKKLALGRVDLVVANREVGYHMLKSVLDEKQRKLITHHPTVVNKTTYHLIIGKKNPRAAVLMNAFNRGLALRRQTILGNVASVETVITRNILEIPVISGD